jgi:hypothetical protein
MSTGCAGGVELVPSNSSKDQKDCEKGIHFNKV